METITQHNSTNWCCELMHSTNRQQQQDQSTINKHRRANTVQYCTLPTYNIHNTNGSHRTAQQQPMHSINRQQYQDQYTINKQSLNSKYSTVPTGNIHHINGDHQTAQQHRCTASVDRLVNINKQLQQIAPTAGINR